MWMLLLFPQSSQIKGNQVPFKFAKCLANQRQIKCQLIRHSHAAAQKDNWVVNRTWENSPNGLARAGIAEESLADREFQKHTLLIQKLPACPAGSSRAGAMCGFCSLNFLFFGITAWTPPAVAESSPSGNKHLALDIDTWRKTCFWVDNTQICNSEHSQPTFGFWWSK